MFPEEIVILVDLDISQSLLFLPQATCCTWYNVDVSLSLFDSSFVHPGAWCHQSFHQLPGDWLRQGIKLVSSLQRCFKVFFSFYEKSSLLCSSLPLILWVLSSIFESTNQEANTEKRTDDQSGSHEKLSPFAVDSTKWHGFMMCYMSKATVLHWHPNKTSPKRYTLTRVNEWTTKLPLVCRCSLFMLKINPPTLSLPKSFYWSKLTTAPGADSSCARSAAVNPREFLRLTSARAATRIFVASNWVLMMLMMSGVAPWWW